MRAARSAFFAETFAMLVGDWPIGRCGRKGPRWFG